MSKNLRIENDFGQIEIDSEARSAIEYVQKVLVSWINATAPPSAAAAEFMHWFEDGSDCPFSVNEFHDAQWRKVFAMASELRLSIPEFFSIFDDGIPECPCCKAEAQKGH